MDRLSLLPDCLFLHILSFLNTQEVIQTCLLSKRWKLLWTQIPTLDFDFNSYSYSFQGQLPDSALIERSFQQFVLTVLSRHSGNHIQKLSFSSSENNDERVLTEFLICYARSHKVQDLCIYTDFTAVFDWKSCLSGFKSLTELKISCWFVDDWGALMLPSLKTLEIVGDWERRVGDESGIERRMFSGCPNLESLVLVDYLYENVYIWGPKLEYLELCVSSLEGELAFRELKLFTPNLKIVKFENYLPTLNYDIKIPNLKIMVEGNHPELLRALRKAKLI